MESEKKISVCLTFDFDAISLWLGGFGARSLSAISRGEFGRVGAERLIAMLREWRIRSTWFIPGHSAENLSANRRTPRGRRSRDCKSRLPALASEEPRG